MRNQYFFELEVSVEQIGLAYQLVDYSIAHHPVKDIFSKDPEGKARQRDFRFTGTIGEVVFADAYNLPRPTRSFGAIDGQDFGQDFLFDIGSRRQSFDIKAMMRQNNRFRENYVLNLPAYQMRRSDVITDYYFCISFHTESNSKLMASFLGYVAKTDIENGKIGILYKAQTRRVKDNGDSFLFQRDTYEVDFGDITSPPIPKKYKYMAGFKIKNILPK